MNPYVVKYRIWAMALRKNPQTGTYTTRQVTTTINGTDPTTNYNLLRLTNDEPDMDELAMAGLTLQDSVETWYIYQVDLDLSGGPKPNTGFTLTINGVLWVIKTVRGEAMNQAWRCLCQQGRP